MTIERDALLSLVRRLVAQRSENPPGDETGVADVLERRLAESPVAFDIERYEVAPGRPNLVAQAGDSGRGSLLLTGHMDVVPASAEEWSGDPYRLREEGGRAIGRGTADMKGALAAKVLAAESYLADPAAGGVTLAFVCDEEHGGIGTKALVERGINADHAVIGEPTGLQVCTAQKGVVRYRITVHGRSAHTGAPDRGVNAILGLDRVVRQLERFHDERGKETAHSLLTPETVTVTEIDGGIAPNVVPDSATLTVDWRLLPDGASDPGRFDRKLRDVVSEPVVDGRTLDVSIERTVFARGAEIEPEHDLARTVLAAAGDAGLDSRLVGFNAATDARFLINDAGIPTVLFGPGSIEDDAHTVDESIRIDELASTAETYERLLERLCG